MYLDFTVEIPREKGKIFKNKLKNTTYICYEFDRVYHPDRKYNTPKRTTIGKVCEDDPERMYPNQNYLKFFPDAELPEESESDRSSCLKIGNYLVIRKIIRDYGLDGLLACQFGDRDRGLLTDLIAYTIVAENNAGQYYPDYTYNHPLFTKDMRMYSDSTVSDFLNDMDVDQRIGFLNSWNESRDHRERIYISYDSTNKKCQAGDVEIAEYGHSKEDKSKPIINYAVAYDKTNREPLFYEDYCGSINDVSQLQQMVGKAKGFGYHRIGFILDRGYFSKENIHLMDRCGYQFVIMVKGMKDLVNELVMEAKGTFEDKRACAIKGFRAYGTTVKRQLYPSDKQERYFHVFYKTGKAHAERDKLEDDLERMAQAMRKKEGERDVSFGPGIEKYYELEYSKDGTFIGAREKKDVIERELKLCGYFVIITSEEMTAAEALELYKSRDASEKLFRGDKSYLGNRSYRNHFTESVEAKIFVEFIALIVRNRIYTCLKDENERLKSRQNYMTVPAAVRELEKIELIRLLDGEYRLDHSITAKQKTILNAFGMDTNYIKNSIRTLTETLNGLEG